MKCLHEQFEASVDVNRMMKNPTDSEPSGYMAEIKIRCSCCGLPFEFIGIEGCGMKWDKPMLSPDAQVLRQPIQPKGLRLLPALPGFEVRAN